MARPSDGSDRGHLSESFPTTVTYGDRLLELVEFNGGFTLQYGETSGSYQLYPPAEEGSEREYFGAPWAAWLAGTDGAHLGIEVVPADSCLGPIHFFMISLLDGSVRSCTISLSRFQLVTTASPNDSEAWLENPRFPADDSLDRDDCEPFDGNYSLWSSPQG
ncbi:hypothetical protein [Candidatus Poriferisodalis sp.]|uniref:hypothetical protein n=1 Tax=Candidatus Poriferisodalis sp. TaxID=3101277 RepID=UPI003B0137F1